MQQFGLSNDFSQKVTKINPTCSILKLNLIPTIRLTYDSPKPCIYDVSVHILMYQTLSNTVTHDLVLVYSSV